MSLTCIIYPIEVPEYGASLGLRLFRQGFTGAVLSWLRPGYALDYPTKEKAKMNHVLSALKNTETAGFSPGGLAAETAASIISAAIGAQATSVAESAATKAKAEAVLAAASAAKAHKEEVKEDRASASASRAVEKHYWAREAQSRKNAKRIASEAFRLRDCLEAEGGLDVRGLEDLVAEVGRWAVTDRKDLLARAKKETSELISAWGF